MSGEMPVPAPDVIGTPEPAAVATFATRLLQWWDRHGRKQLPWQQERTPYRVWLSEVMLQQTQVATATPYFLRFTAAYPTVQALAAAPLDDVLHLWSGLGYYARARNLHAAARDVVARYGGFFPGDLAELQSLPGVGRSTAAAILSLAHDARHTILDGNVKRVLTRWAGIEGYPGLPAIERRLWALAEACTPGARNADYTQAIMDLGATLCTRTRPACGICPLHEDCIARVAGRQSLLPTPKPVAKARRVRRVVALVAVGSAGIWLEQRPTRGIWGGLWSFPEFADEAEALAGHGFAAARTAAALTWPVVFHAFTHYDLELVPWVLPVAEVGGRRVQDVAVAGVWYNGAADVRLGLPAPVERLVAAVLAGQSGEA